MALSPLRNTDVTLRLGYAISAGTMTVQMALKGDDFESRAISPLFEIGAYEALWLKKGASFQSIAELFRSNGGAVPSDFVEEATAREYAQRVLDVLHGDAIRDFGVRIHGAGESPGKLRDAKLRPAHIEGEGGAEWVLMDYLDFVVHVFVRDRRTFYSLEKLWAGAPRLEFPVPAASASAVRRPGA